MVFSHDFNMVLQTVLYSHAFPKVVLEGLVDSEDWMINDLFFAEDHWVLHMSRVARMTHNQAIRSRDHWDAMESEISNLGKEKWRIRCITWGTGDWVAVLARPLHDAKPTSWFGGSFERAHNWLADKGPDYFVDYCTWVDEEDDYFLAVTLDRVRAASQLVFFTTCYPLKDPAVSELLKSHSIVQLAGGPDGWITVFGPPADISHRTIVTSAVFPSDIIQQKQEQGLWLKCLRFVPSDAPN